MQKPIRLQILLLQQVDCGLFSRRRERIRPAALAALCGIILSTSAFAQEPQADEPSPTEIHTPRITLVPGEDGGHIRFEIKGKEVAIIDETGLHVRGDINYGGMLSDYGNQGFDDHAVTNRGKADAE